MVLASPRHSAWPPSDLLPARPPLAFRRAGTPSEERRQQKLL